MGAGRTLKAVAQRLRKSYTIIRRWKVEWDWDIRAGAWDNAIAEAAIKKASGEYAKMLESQINIGKMLQSKAAKALLTINFDDAEIKHLPSLLEMINSGVKIERTSRELTEIAAEKNQRQNLTINIIAREPAGGEGD
ncbi:MAG: hypothetical protein IJT73_03670 [Selenomonadaceae bacterium]|nr:hypothetical protein [Selenomonadaceae bacterium]